MFENLKKAIDKEEKEQAEKAYKRACADESYLRKLLTGNQWEKYTSGSLDREKVLDLARKKAAREAKKAAQSAKRSDPLQIVQTITIRAHSGKKQQYRG